MRTQLLQPGEPAPWFSADTQTKPGFQFHLAAGRYVAYCFFQSAARSDSSQILASALQSPLFDDYSATFFGVSTDPPATPSKAALVERHPGVRHFRDFSGVISRAYGAIASTASASDYRARLLLDPTLRVAAVIPFSELAGCASVSVDCRTGKTPPAGRFRRRHDASHGARGARGI